MKKSTATFSIFCGMALLVAAALAAPSSFALRPASDAGDSDQAKSKHESPFYCDSMALDPAARKRHFDEVGPALRSMIQQVRELSDGYEFRFSSDPKLVGLVAEWAAGERLCCPFLDIQFRMEREGGPLWLRLTGRKGTKEFLKADAPKWINP